MCACPQKENGYTAIANEILDILCKTKLASGERQILDVILRKTYGFNKKQDRISYQQFEDATTLKRRAIIYVVQNLQAKKMIKVWKNRNDEQNEPNLYQFNKDYDEWVVQNSAPQVKKNRLLAKKSSAKLRKLHIGSAKPMQKVVQNLGKKRNSFAPTKERDIKDNTKERESTPKQLTEKFFDGVLNLMKGDKVEWLQEMFRIISEQNKIPKIKLWFEVRRFCDYWTEKNGTGTREKWQLQKTFEVDKRLATWFRRNGEFKDFSVTGIYKQKGREIIGL